MYAPASTWPVWVVVLYRTVQLGLDLSRPHYAEDTWPALIVDSGDACQVFTVEARQSIAARVAQDVTKKLVAEGIHLRVRTARAQRGGGGVRAPIVSRRKSSRLRRWSAVLGGTPYFSSRGPL